MAWKIEFTATAKKQLERLPPTLSHRLVIWLKDRILTTHNPRLWGEPLRGHLKHQWRYRVGDYRILCEIQDSLVTVRVVTIGHRREVYR